MANKMRRRAKRHYEKHREYFETLARQVLENGETTIDFGVVTIGARLIRSGGWLDIEDTDGSVRSGSDITGLHGEKLVSAIASQLISVVAHFPGVQIVSSS